MDQFDLFEEARADAAAIPRDEQLGRVAELAEAFSLQERLIAQREEELRIAKEEMRKIAEDLLPEAMQAVGLSEFKLKDGSKVSVKPWHSLSIPKDREEEAYRWLEENGHGDIVKHSLTIGTRLSSEALLEKVREVAKSMNLDIADKIGIHHMTGGSWVKERLKEGDDIPRDLLGVTTGFRAKVERAK